MTKLKTEDALGRLPPQTQPSGAYVAWAKSRRQFIGSRTLRPTDATIKNYQSHYLRGTRLDCDLSTIYSRTRCTTSTGCKLSRVVLTLFMVTTSKWGSDSRGWRLELTRDVTHEGAGDYLAGERIAHAWTRRLYAEMAPPLSRGARESEDGFYASDDDFSFPPTAHPARELFTASLFVLVILTFVVWGGLNLILLTLAALL